MNKIELLKITLIALDLIVFFYNNLVSSFKCYVRKSIRRNFNFNRFSISKCMPNVDYYNFD